MGMVVRSNIMALNANRQLGMNNSSVSKNLEKLSSGFKINRAGDDASGLAISEKMKAQIKGLDAASANSQDGISLVQTAEGALTEVHDMLNRMVELAEKSANGTMEVGVGTDPGTDRKALQDEMDQLSTEIDRIAKSTNFNNIKLLDGNLSGTNAANNTGTPTVAVDAGNAAGLGAPTAFAFDAAATDAQKAALNTALGDGADLTITVATIATSVTIAGIPTGYKLFAKGADGNDFEVTDGASIAAAAITANAGELVNTGALDFTLKDADGNTIGTFGFAANALTDGTSTVTLSAGAAAAGAGAAGNGPTVTPPTSSTITNFDAGGLGAGTFDIDLTGMSVDKAGDVKFTIGAKEYTVSIAEADIADPTAIATALKTAIDADPLTDVTGGALTAADNGDGTLTFTATNNAALTDFTAATAVSVEGVAGAGNGNGTGLLLQIGDTNDQFNKMTVNVISMQTKDLFNTTMSDGTSILTDANGDAVLKEIGDASDPTKSISSFDISSQTNAGAALTAIKKVINVVSTQRAELGAIQNRLEHTINNLDVASENMNAANSRIRDTDMAKQMMEYTKMNVLTQAAQAMLAQANQQPQSILQLLQ